MIVRNSLFLFMATASFEFPFAINAHSKGNSRFLSPKVEFSTVKFPSAVEFSKLNLYPSSTFVSSTPELEMVLDFSDKTWVQRSDNLFCTEDREFL